MNIEKFAMAKNKANQLWKEYIAACKDNPKDKFLNDMKKVYSQLKSGRKVVDINKIFEASLINEKHEPKLAIAKATNREISMEYWENGTVIFGNGKGRWGRTTSYDIVISNIFPKLPREQWDGQYSNRKNRKAPVPAIPASVRPKGSLEGYYILWEVEKWEKIPPKDPYLLRRITPNMFVVVAGWNLSELERAVMRGRIY